METVKKIMWVDDDINRSILRPYLDELTERGYAIIRVQSVDEIKSTINSSMPISLMILDVSMPPGESLDFKESRGGIQTGYLLLKELVANKILEDVIKIVFTIVDNNNLIDFCAKNKIPIYDKEEYLSVKFADEIDSILQKSDKENG